MSTEQDTAILNKTETRDKITDWVKTTRIQTAMVTALAVWIGHVSVSPMSARDAILLGLVGVLVHIWGFTLNEVEDYIYDKKHENAEGHPIAQGKVHAGSARVLAWIAAVMAVVTLTTSGVPLPSVVVLLLSFVPGYAYDKWSKSHWWSNGYLSIWAMMMVMTGALYAGTPTVHTVIVATAVSIQIFVQVIQGDLKDIEGPESTFAEVCGVRVSTVKSRVLEHSGSGGEVCQVNRADENVLSYSKLFIGVVYGMKLLEAGLIFVLVVMTFRLKGFLSQAWILAVFVVAIAFIWSASMFLVYVYDRDEIKERSSTHELTSIVLLGLAVVGLDSTSAMLIMVAPIVWYVATNAALHSSALNPDI
jgi:hypothetical protein